MKRSPRARRTPSKLSESTHHRLNLYVLAASAAGVGTLALSSPAQAKIVYTPAHVNLGNYNLDLNHDGITDFTFYRASNCDMSHCTADEGLYKAPPPNAIAGRNGSAAPLWPGAEIGSKRRYWAQGSVRIERKVTNYHSGTHGTTTTVFSGRWANGGKGFKGHYLGLKFLINGKVHYGWARLNTTRGPLDIVLTGYAYETIAGKAIIAGQTRGTDDSDFEQTDAALTMPTTAPATLGALAMGAPGLSIWRRKEQVGATQ